MTRWLVLQVHHGSHFAELAYQGKAIAAAVDISVQGAVLEKNRWHLKPNGEDRAALLQADVIGDSAKLVHVARSRGLLWNLSDAESFVADVACKETAFLELMKHNFPDIYAQIRAPVQATAEQHLTQTVAEQSVSPPELPTVGAMQPIAPMSIPNSTPAPTEHDAPQTDQAGAPSVHAAAHLPRPRRLPKGKSAGTKRSSYCGQNHTGPRVQVDPKKRARMDKKNLNKRIKRQSQRDGSS